MVLLKRDVGVPVRAPLFVLRLNVPLGAVGEHSYDVGVPPVFEGSTLVIGTPFVKVISSGE